MFFSLGKRNWEEKSLGTGLPVIALVFPVYTEGNETRS